MSESIVLCGNLVLNQDQDSLLLLFRKDHEHYETPGGKLEAGDCANIERPTMPELERAATRELLEEVGGEVLFSEPEYFGSVEFTTPDGRVAIAHKFLTQILGGEPEVNEPETFARADFIKIKELERTAISKDLRLLLPKIKQQLL